MTDKIRRFVQVTIDIAKTSHEIQNEWETENFAPTTQIFKRRNWGYMIKKPMAWRFFTVSMDIALSRSVIFYTAVKENANISDILKTEVLYGYIQRIIDSTY